jgi:alkaline phosphatase D
MKVTFEQGLRIFREQVPMSERTYRTFRWGKTLQIVYEFSKSRRV